MPNPVPAGYATVTPYLCVADAAKLIEFLKQAFDAQLLFKMDGPGGRIMHAEMTIGDSRIMLAQPEPGKETHAMLHLYMPDTDASTSALSPPGPHQFASRRINSTETAAPACAISLAISGISPRTSRTSHRKRWNAAWRRKMPAPDFCNAHNSFAVRFYS